MWREDRKGREKTDIGCESGVFTLSTDGGRRKGKGGKRQKGGAKQRKRGTGGEG